MSQRPTSRRACSFSGLANAQRIYLAFGTMVVLVGAVCVAGYVGVQIPTWDSRCIDLAKAADSQDYCDELAGTCREAGVEITPALLERAYRGLAQRYDARHGGFEGAPKFPQAMALDFLLRGGEFQALFTAVRAELIDTVFAVTAVVEKVLSRAGQVRRELKGSVSLAMAPALSDIKAQLGQLIVPGFVAATGWRHLQHLPRLRPVLHLHLKQLRIREHRRHAHLAHEVEAVVTRCAVGAETDRYLFAQILRHRREAGVLLGEAGGRVVEELAGIIQECT